MGAATRGKIVLSNPRGEMGRGDAHRVPLIAVRHRRARQTSESGPCGDCRRVLWELGPRGYYSRKFVLSRNIGYRTRVVAMLPGTGPSTSCGYCCSRCPSGGRYPGKVRFIEPQGGNGPRRRAPGASNSATPR